MFALDLWDSPLMLLGEIALSIAVVAVIMFAARVVNTRSAPVSDGRSRPSEPERDTTGHDRNSGAGVSDKQEQ